MKSIYDSPDLPDSKRPWGPKLEQTKVSYLLHDPFHPPRRKEADLIAFVYDADVGSCGIFPPYQILNQILAKGGGDQGMSPGTSWEPFSLDQQQYKTIVERIKNTDPYSLDDDSESFRIKFHFDDSYDDVKEWKDWIFKISNKHREEFYLRVERMNQKLQQDT